MAKLTDEDIKKLIKESSCYGICFDISEHECQGCDVKLGCEHHTLARKNQLKNTNITVPAEIAKAPKSEIPEAPKVNKQNKTNNNKKQYKEDMPVFVNYSIEELQDSIVKHGGNLSDFDKYKSTPIKRMRMVMWLKSKYEL